MTSIPFTKMDGLGNDFVIIDNRTGNIRLTTRQIVALGNRKTGVGFDQLIMLENPIKSPLKFCFLTRTDQRRAHAATDRAVRQSC